MTNESLLAYVKKELERGSDIEIVKKLLLETGWSKTDIENAFEDAKKSALLQPAAALTDPAPVKTASLIATYDNYEAPGRPATVTRMPGNSKYFMVAGALSIFLFAAGVLGYYFYNPKPEIIIERMFAAIQQVSALKNRMELKMTSTNDTGAATELKISADTEYDFADEKKIKNRAKLGFELNASQNDKTESITGGGTIESITQENIQYLKISGVDFRIKGGEGDIETNTMIGSLIGVLNGALGNQWVKIDSKETDALTKNFVPPQSTHAIEEAKKQREAAQKKQNEKLQEKLPEILALLQQTTFIDFERVRSDKIGDTDTYLIVGSLNKASTKNFILEAEKILMSNIFTYSMAQSMGLPVTAFDPAGLAHNPSGFASAGLLSYSLAQSLNNGSLAQSITTGLMDPENLTAEKKEALQADLERTVNEIMTKLNSSKIEVWIGKKDYLPYQINLELDIAQELLASPLAAKTSNSFQAGNDPGRTNLTYKILLNDFNVPVEMEEPSDAINIFEILDTLSKKILGGPVTNAPTQKQ